MMQGALSIRSSDESLLISRAKKHDPAAISEVYNRHVQLIFRYIYYRTGDQQIAEDLTAEVFLKAMESLDAYQDRGLPLAAWLCRIAHARVVDYWRHAHRHPQVQLEDSQMGEHAYAEDQFRDVLADQELWAALRQLTEDQQQVLILRFVQDLDLATVAQIMNKTEGAIKSLQHRALASLARLLKKRT